jgi:large subunit ribosomal protein L35
MGSWLGVIGLGIVPNLAISLFGGISEPDPKLDATDTFESWLITAHSRILGNAVKTQIPSRKTMPKLKTHKGAAKRFKKTGTGKIVRGQSKMRHILTSKETKTKRKLAHSALVSDADHAKVARMIPYA